MHNGKVLQVVVLIHVQIATKIPRHQARVHAYSKYHGQQLTKRVGLMKLKQEREPVSGVV